MVIEFVGDGAELTHEQETKVDGFMGGVLRVKRKHASFSLLLVFSCDRSLPWRRAVHGSDIVNYIPSRHTTLELSQIFAFPYPLLFS
jgi:hypothetical protein